MRPINIQSLVNAAKLNRFHYRMLLVCALIIVFDGYDLTVTGIALPWIMKDMALGAVHAGILVSFALIGMVLGNILLGTAADRFGRRRTIALCIFLCSFFTAAAGLVNDPTQFAICRFLAGLGLGGAMPNVVSLMTEFAPRRMKGTLVTLIFSGFSIGGVIAAALGKGWIEIYGWKSVFLAAVAPVFLIPFIWKSTPESVPFLLRHRRFDELKILAGNLEPTYSPTADDHFVGPASTVDSSKPIRQLFTRERALSTLMLWIACFICLFIVYGLSSWLSKLMVSAGYTSASALTFLLVMNIGGMIGAILGGFLSDRLNIKYVLVVMFLMAAGSIATLGYGASPWMIYVLVAVAGASTIGTQNLINAYAGQYYPIAIRTTGVGWMLGIGRFGAIISPVAIGALVNLNLSREQYFMAIGVPGLVAAIAVLLTNRVDNSMDFSEGNETPAQQLGAHT
ncbi:MFS transporter [Paraburkholderia caribensis]|uniref:MFS transporter n=1 Tax=Paraburkholderia caribensis TaxID=75105 RepID=UPI00072257A6|nr:MFS transporter [Paraburkholderia caribensis]ALP68762.1 MFS transporter [Paraburkholderia caribensis]AUT58122.1 MFS transporter [Paraburkholderia caribensis]